MFKTAKLVARERKLPLVHFCIDLRYCDPPGDETEFVGPVPVGTEAMLQTMLADIVRWHRALEEEPDALP